MWKFGTLSVSPFDWMEAGYFYYRPEDLIWGSASKKGQYLDKGFNVKFIYRPKRYLNLPNIALGLDDFAGTGYFSREYLVATKNFNNTSFTFGMGWGKFSDLNSFKNPLSFISEKFSYRPDALENAGFAGQPSTNQWFRGDASFFGGIEYKIPSFHNVAFKLEYDPFNYFSFSANNRVDALRNLRTKDSDINLGFSFPINEYIVIDTSYIKGNMLNINFSFGLQFKENKNKKEFKPEINKKNSKKNDKKTFYKDLLANLNNNNLFLQTADLDENGNLKISIYSTNHRNAVRASKNAGYISKKVADLNNIDLSKITISNLNAGIELNNITFIDEHLSNKNIPIEVTIRNTKLDSGNANSYMENEFQPKVNFPLYFAALNPSINSHVGYPSKFYFGSINMQYLGEIQFKRNLLLTFLINQHVYGNLDEAPFRPDSQLQNVRSAVVKYIQEDDLNIGRLQLDYISSPFKDIYTKASIGIFETMYAGFGIEALYKPFNKKYSIGIEAFEVKQRSYKQRFKFMKYKTFTSHINFTYALPLGIDLNLSYGRYLAKDDGYTFDLSRETDSGFRSGFYFTRTDVPPELFGEGSFDKGFYFQFPLDLFSQDYRGDYSSFKYAPLTRDGGAKLNYDKSLRGLIYNSSYQELNDQWNQL